MNMSSSPEVFNATELKAEILRALAKSDASAPFACHGKVAWAVNPGLDINELGLIGLPLSTREVEILIEKCRKSPFGKGNKTLVDDSVRRSWELNPSEFRITNPAWTNCMNELLSIVHYQLGLTCARANVRADLYKLLIYEPGAFFKPHQDSEKTPGMFGTLVISLPSQHEGGRVVLSHNKREEHYDTSSYSIFDTTFGAWYSDVFHEVEKVTSGFRVVLTFNLVQKQTSLAQRAPDADGTVRLTRAFNAWEHALSKRASNFPPYLVHKLDHQYTEESLCKDTLRGIDDTHVFNLDQVCQLTGWRIYFAMHEKTLSGDDDLDLTDYDREDEFQNVTDLEGSPAHLQPDYDQSCYLDGNESDDGEADESEHEGYTGNEGAPATLWYRKSVVLLVPPSRTFDFGLTPEQKNTAVLKKVTELGPQAHHDESAKLELYNICSSVLTAEMTSGSWPKTSDYSKTWQSYNDGLTNTKKTTSNEPSCERAIAKVALEQDWLDLFDRIPVTHKVEPEVVRALGEYLRKKGISKATRCMNKILHEVANISSKYAVLRDITKAFNSVDTSSVSQDMKVDFDQWYSSAIRDILGTRERTNPADGTTLATIAKACATDIKAEILQKFHAAHTPTIAAFIIEFARDNPSLQSTSQHRCLEVMLNKLWSQFSYYTMQPQTYGPAKMDSFDINMLGPLLTITKDNAAYNNSQGRDNSMSTIVLPYVLHMLADTTLTMDAKYPLEDLLLVVRDIVWHRIPALIIEGANPADVDLYDALSHLIITVIIGVIRRLGDEPKKPIDWSLPAKSCGCEPCKAIAEFMRHPTQRDISYPTNGSNRKHLDRQYGLYGYSYSSQGESIADYKIGEDKTKGSPYRWTCYKEHNNYQRNHRNWTMKRDHVQARLKEIDKKGGLKNWLGENYAAIMQCKVESLPSMLLQQQQPRLGELGQAAVNERSGRIVNDNNKRGNSDEEGPENVKRSRMTEPEVIDLT